MAALGRNEPSYPYPGMTRRAFMLAMAWFHMAFGAFFLFFQSFASRIIFSEPGPNAPMMMVGLSGIVFAFGLINYLARDSAESQAMRAVLIGTAFYLVFTVIFDSYWTIQGLLNPIAWLSIGIRSVMAGCYGYFLLKDRPHGV